MADNAIHPHGWRYFLDTISREPMAFQKTLAAMDAAKKKTLLMVRLSDTVRENALTYIAGDRFANDHKWRSPWLADALDAIEELKDVTNEERFKLLTSANELGQTVFHKTLKYAQNANMFSMLESKLIRWGGEEAAAKFIDSIWNAPLGTIAPEVSKAFKNIKNSTMPYTSEDHQRLASLEEGNYQPATAEGLRKTIDKLRPRLQTWIDGAQKAYDHLVPDTQKMVELIKAFNANANPVTEENFKLHGRDKTSRPQPPQP